MEKKQIGEVLQVLFSIFRYLSVVILELLTFSTVLCVFVKFTGPSSLQLNFIFFVSAGVIAWIGNIIFDKVEQKRGWKLCPGRVLASIQDYAFGYLAFAIFFTRAINFLKLKRAIA